MDFVSLLFIAWIIVFVVLSWISAKTYTAYFLILFGLSFIFVASPMAGLVLLSESLLCYYICLKRNAWQWIYTLLTVILLFTAFLFCKFQASKNNMAIPLGISYFTFRLIHYVQEKYRQRLREHSMIEFLAYISFFPSYTVGPINLFPQFLHNLRRRAWSNSQFSYGLERLFYGYAQLIILGNYLINYVLKNWVNIHLSNYKGMPALIIHSVQLWLDLYIRFSAYTHIAIGIAAMAGFVLPENFNYPFLASNIREFWQRWHLSLTNWCRDYIFIPLAAITRKPLLAIMATMLTIGIWHELSFRYILWGLYHALGIIVYEKYKLLVPVSNTENKFILMLQKCFGIVFTLVFVIMSFPVTTVLNNYLITFLK